MKKNYVFRMVCLITIAYINLYSDCGKDPVPEGDYIPLISNTWRNINDADNTFFFFRENETNKSNITGNVNLTGVAAQAHVKGFYENTYIEFTYEDGPFQNKKYTGNFQKNSNPLRMVLKSGAETLTLQRE
jgi:hypothetical protein